MPVRPATPESMAKLRKAFGAGFIVFGARKPVPPQNKELQAKINDTNSLADADPIVQGLKRMGLPVNLKNYLDLGFRVSSLDELTPEEQAQVPLEIRKSNE